VPVAVAASRDATAPRRGGGLPEGREDPGPASVAPAPATTAGERGLVALGLVGAFAVSWAAGRSGAATTDLGRLLGRLDGSLALLLLVAGALAQRSVTARALAAAPVPSPVAGWRLLLRRVLVPWWVVVTVATFGYPTAAGQVVPTDTATPTWIHVVREWLLLSPLGRAEAGTPWPPAGAGRLGHAWVLTTAVLLWLLLPAWERLLRSAGARLAGSGSRRWGPVELAAGAGAGLALVGLALRVAVATTGPGAWSAVARVAPPAQLDVIGAGLALGALVAGARVGVGPLAHGAGTTVRAAAPRLGAVTALALLVGAAGPQAGSLLDTGGAVATLVARAGLVLVGAALVLWALLPAAHDGPPAWAAARDRAGRWGAPVALGAFLVVPLAAQLWATRAGGPPGTQRLGPMVLATVLGSLAGGAALAAAGRRLFGPRGERRLNPFAARLAVVTSGALAWRLLTLVSINRRNPDGGDPFFYHHQANMLADRIGYSEPFRWVEQGIAVPSAIHPPLLSTWLAAGSLLGARTFLAHKLLTTLVGVAVVVVAALVARRLAGDRAALVTAVLVAAYPNLWVIDGALWPEGVYATGIGLAVLAAYRWWEHPDLRRAAVLGAVVGVAALARGEALFLFPLLVAPVVLRRRGLPLGAKVRAGLAAGACGLLVLVPWSARNLAAFDQPVLLSTNSDEVLYYANCPDSYGLPDPHAPAGTEGAQVAGQLGYWSFNCQQRERARAGQPVTDSVAADRYQRCLGDRAGEVPYGVVPGEPPGNEAEKARYWRCLGLSYATGHLDRLPAVVAARLGRELDVYHLDDGLNALKFEGRPEGAALAGRWAWWALAPAGLAGWLVLRRRRVLVLPLVALGLMVLATTVYAYGAIRFRTPLELGLLIGAGVLVDHLLRRRGRPESAGPAESVADEEGAR